MSDKKSFSGTPYARPPSTPRQQLAGRVSTSGSILKTLFSPAKWFGKTSRSSDAPSRSDVEEEDSDEAEEENDQAARDTESSEEDEEERIGLQRSGATPMNQMQTPNTAKKTGMSLPSSNLSSPHSPNSLLATFFSNKGDAPLTAVELEGVKAILARQVEVETAPSAVQGQAPSYATPARRPYQPIFTPANMLPTTRAVTEVKKVRRGYVPSTTVASPFRSQSNRRGLTVPRTPHPAQFTTPAKYALSTSIASDQLAVTENGKRNLEDVVAPAPKRQRQESPEADKTSSPDGTSTGHQTAASILEILDSEQDLMPNVAQTKSPETPRRVLNPYSTSNSARRPASTVRKSPAKRGPRSATEEVARSEAIDRKIPYQPKKSSGLANSFTAADDDDTSLFSPRRQIQASARRSQQENKQSDTRDSSFKLQESATPTKASTKADALDSQVTKPALFDSGASLKTQSTTPKFSFSASQMSSKSSITTTDTVVDKESTVEVKQVPANDTEDVDTTSKSAKVKSPGPKHFTFGLPASTQVDSSLQSETSDAKVPSAPVFNFGGLAKPSSDPASTPVFNFGGLAKPASDPVSTPVFHFGNVSGTSEGSEQARDDSVVVHQLRDGTEYVSPSKPQVKSNNVNNAEDKSKSSGFVFNPTHTKSSSSFSFANYKEPAQDVPTSGGFVFDPSKKTTDSSVSEMAKQAETAAEEVSSASPQMDVKQRVLAVPVDELQSFDFTISSKQIPDELCKKVLQAQLLEIKFGTKNAVKSQPTAATGFDWEAAGMKRPQSSGWTCSVCMVDNKADAEKCISCESKAPVKTLTSSSSQSTSLPSMQDGGSTIEPPAAKTLGGFDWSAAGLQKPAQQWSCSTCMTSNPDSAKTCLACEAER